jgi:phosphoribosylaminoimidazole-succinocarboxamide synthase
MLPEVRGPSMCNPNLFHLDKPDTNAHQNRYEKTQTIHGLPQPAGLSRCEKLPQPIYTPSTKAEIGEKDENISPDEARKIVGDKYAARIEELALACYKAGAAYAEERGIIIVSPH